MFFGKIAITGDFYFNKRMVAVPLIEDDVIGVIVVGNDPKNRFFTKGDLEILKTVSEQTVIAIKNSQLFEHQEKMTTESVQAISNLIDLSVKKKKKRSKDTLLEKLIHEMGEELHLAAKERMNLSYAAKLIDAGYLGIPKSIQSKKKPLTAKEYEIIKTHPFHGVELIKSIDALKPVVPIILYQNERFDGSGYPHGLSGEEIPLGARILSLTVAFVAMISKRPYREAKDLQDALEEIVSVSGKQFDPKVVDAFFNIIEKEDVLRDIYRKLKEEGRNGSEKTKYRN